jgi:hypothetical protein
LDLLVNDLSFHGQFLELKSFKEAIQRLMAIRQIAFRFGTAFHCHRKIAQAQITPTSTMPKAVQSLAPDERRALMQWLTQYGPFWEDVRNHGPDDWLQYNGNIVTDTAVGEAAWCCLNGIERWLVSLIPSDWQFSPVSVDWVSDTIGTKSVDVANHWDPIKIEASLHAQPTQLASWPQVDAIVKTRFTQLTFADNAFASLTGHPFMPGAAHRLIFLLNILNRFKNCFDANGLRTSEGHEIYSNFFTGKKGAGGRGALFSDSSEDEKSGFKKEMTFKHPVNSKKTLFCPWHGKVQSPQLRIHFSWPIRANEPLYVVYVGPKITKR